MMFINATAARRSAALLAFIALAGCENATRTLEPIADNAVTLAAGPTVASSASGSGTSSPSVNSVNLDDPSFESGYTGGWTFQGNPGTYVDIGSLWTAAHGKGSVDLNGVVAGSVEQSFSTIPGVQYTVQFDLAGNPGAPQGVKTLEVSAANDLSTYSFDTNGKSGSNMGWTPQTFSFTATGTKTTLVFRSTYMGGKFPDRAQGPAIDNVRVTWVPTPTTTTVTFGSGPFVYTGSAFTATASVSPAAAGSPVISYSGDCTNPGSTCTATATFAASGEYAASTATADITIEKVSTTTTVSFGAGPFVYNGSAFTATASVSPSPAGAATISYSGDCTNAGSTCTATATFAGDATYAASTASVGITIAKAPTTTSVTFGSGPFVYTGSAFTATASVSPASAGGATISYSGQCTFAGTCTASAAFGGNANFLPSSAAASITIRYPVAATDGQCKNGGWRYMTDDLGNLFKNQGDCVSFVATKGKNKGAG